MRLPGALPSVEERLEPGAAAERAQPQSTVFPDCVPLDQTNVSQSSLTTLLVHLVIKKHAMQLVGSYRVNRVHADMMSFSGV